MYELATDIIEEGIKRGIPVDVIREAVSSVVKLKETREGQLVPAMKARKANNNPPLTAKDIGMLFYDKPGQDGRPRPVTNWDEAFRMLQNAAHMAGVNYNEEDLKGMATTIVSMAGAT